MRIANQPIREAVQSQPLSLHRIAMYMGLPDPKKRGAQRIARCLGIQTVWESKNGRGKPGPKHRETMDHDFAVRIIRAAHIDPVDVGL